MPATLTSGQKVVVHSILINMEMVLTHRKATFHLVRLPDQILVNYTGSRSLKWCTLQ